ncbi:hypothetical protein BDR04DRAFT_1106211 [Suillus decipiens]|nr:hypothetical protein BDR04DRAFT_1106211 [Suillus decipiens]
MNPSSYIGLHCSLLFLVILILVDKLSTIPLPAFKTDSLSGASQPTVMRSSSSIGLHYFLILDQYPPLLACHNRVYIVFTAALAFLILVVLTRSPNSPAVSDLLLPEPFGAGDKQWCPHPPKSM